MSETDREPTLEDVLSEPVVHTLMARDRVEASDLRALLQKLSSTQAKRPPGEVKAAAALQWLTSRHEQGRRLGLRYSTR